MANGPTYRGCFRPQCVVVDTPEGKAAKRAAWLALPLKPKPEKPKAEKPRIPRQAMARATDLAGVSKIQVDQKYAARAKHGKGRGNCHGFVRRCQLLVINNNAATCSRYDQKLNWSNVFPAGVRRCKECKCKGVW